MNFTLDPYVPMDFVHLAPQDFTNCPGLEACSTQTSFDLHHLARGFSMGPLQGTKFGQNLSPFNIFQYPGSLQDSWQNLFVQKQVGFRLANHPAHLFPPLLLLGPPIQSWSCLKSNSASHGQHLPTTRQPLLWLTPRKPFLVWQKCSLASQLYCQLCEPIKICASSSVPSAFFSCRENKLITPFVGVSKQKASFSWVAS